MFRIDSPGQSAFHATALTLILHVASAHAQGNPADQDRPRPLPPAPVAPPLPPAATGPAPGPWQDVPDAQGEAAPPPSALRPRVAAFVAQHRDSLGRSCRVEAVERAGDHAYVACGHAGLWVVDVDDGTFELSGIYDVGGFARGLSLRDGAVWVDVVRVSSFPVDVAQRVGSSPVAVMPVPQWNRATSPPLTRQEVDVPPAPPDPAADLSVPRWEAKKWTVKGVERRGVLISAGANDGIREGQTIEVSRPGQRETWVGEVESVWKEEALVAFGNNEPPTDVQIATPTSRRPTASWIAPPRVAQIWELQAFVRPFLPVSPSGFGMLADASVGYRFQHVHVWGELSPAGFAVGDVEMGTIGGQVFVTYDSHLFELGLGGGAQTVNTPDFPNPAGSGIALSLFMRVGASDGLNLQMQAGEALFRREFEFTELDITAQFPLNAGSWIQVRGAGGSVGYALGEARLRTRVSGNGTAGTVYLHTAGGVAGVLQACDRNVSSTCGSTNTRIGPHIGLGGEWRF